MPGACHRARSAAGPHEANGPSSTQLRDTGRNVGWRDKTHPTSPLPRPIREKVRPASTKTPNVGCCERTGRAFSRTGRSDVAALKPTTPLQPLTWASMKPPSPLRAPKQQPLKPLAPLQPKNTPQTPISHPQRRRRFQLAHLTGPQRRCRFQSRLSLREQRRQGFQSDATRHEQRCHWFQPDNALRRIGKRTRSHTSTPGTAGVEGAEGTCRGAGGRWRGLAGLRDDVPSKARGADGSRAGRRPPAHTAAGPPAPGTPVGQQVPTVGITRPRGGRPRA